MKTHRPAMAVAASNVKNITFVIKTCVSNSATFDVDPLFIQTTRVGRSLLKVSKDVFFSMRF